MILASVIWGWILIGLLAVTPLLQDARLVRPEPTGLRPRDMIREIAWDQLLFPVLLTGLIAAWPWVVFHHDAAVARLADNRLAAPAFHRPARFFGPLPRRKVLTQRCLYALTIAVPLALVLFADWSPLVVVVIAYLAAWSFLAKSAERRRQILPMSWMTIEGGPPPGQPT